MDLKMPAQREKITSELKRAIQNINRNLYEWKDKKAGKTNFSISYTEVFSLTRNWVIRCLRSILDPSTTDRIFKGGNLYIQVDETGMALAKISVSSHETYKSYYKDSVLINEILTSLDYKALAYNPKDYEMDGLTINSSGFDPHFTSSLNKLENFKF